jgi:hypothetical protein
MKRFYGDMFGIQGKNQNWTNTCATFDTGDVRFVLHAIPAGIAETN